MDNWTAQNQGPGLYLENSPMVQRNLDNYRIALGLARRCQNAEAIRFYTEQVKACELTLRIIQEAHKTVQQGLFD